MSSLYTATELGTDLQTLGYLGHHPVDQQRLRRLRKSLGFELPRVGKWLLKRSAQHGIGQAELSGWILAGEHPPEPAGLPSALRPEGEPGPDALPSARYGGLLRLGQNQNGEYWGADLHRKTMPVYSIDPNPDSLRIGWRRRFDRLDDFVFFGLKAALCQRDRITVEEFVDLARERGVRPDDLIPDSLEDERDVVNRSGMRRPKKVSPIANRFIWLDIVLVGAHFPSATVNEVARIYCDVHRLHHLREESERSGDPSAAAFWLFKHTLFGDTAAYKKTLARASKPSNAMVAEAHATCQQWLKTKSKQFDRARLARAIEERSARVR
ncbi:MAG: hypothetical protein MUF64_09630 [Polyangiaceae bacterium]|jgi:hypothetical protein|nr:hypothetical protein [Polyangiaceae bacterium]